MKKILWKLLHLFYRPAQFAPGSIKNILIIRMNRIGDMICTMPLVKTLRKEFPDARLTVLAEDTNAEIARSASCIDRVIVYSRKGEGILRNKHLRMRKTLKGSEFDLAIGVKGGFSSNLAIAAFLSRATYRVGYVSENYHPLDILYNVPVDGIGRTGHQIEQCLNLLKSIGIHPDRFLKDISFEVPEASKAAFRDFLNRTTGVKRGQEKAIVLNISNNSPESTWPLGNFIHLTEMLRRSRIGSILITSAPADSDRAKAIASASGEAIVYETPHVMDLAAAVETADLFICHDCGAMHIGAAVKTKTLVLVGRGIAPEVWGPYGEGHKCIIKPSIKDITVHEVFNEAVRMLNRHDE